jgi:hypothetical protein
LQLAVVRQDGYDAIRKTPGGDQLLEIKGRCVPRGGGSQRVGSIALNGAWETVLLVLRDEEFNATEIYEADRDAITEALQRPAPRHETTEGNSTSRSSRLPDGGSGLPSGYSRSS